MMGMDYVNQQARERGLTKRSQAERLAIADSLIASVWEEYLNGSIDRSNLQLAVNIQINVNRIVWKLNALNNPNTPNTLETLEQPEQRWIPISERLPEEGERVLCTHIGGLNPNRQVIEHIYQNGKFTLGWDMDVNPNSPTFGQRYMGKVIAWMPLPEPYVGEQE